MKVEVIDGIPFHDLDDGDTFIFADERLLSTNIKMKCSMSDDLKYFVYLHNGNLFKFIEKAVSPKYVVPVPMKVISE